jgi:hypothetical protein
MFERVERNRPIEVTLKYDCCLTISESASAANLDVGIV